MPDRGKKGICKQLTVAGGL